MPVHPGYKEPRSYVVIKPLPIPSQKGLKIQSRSPTHYNCWEPCREEVFKANYYRWQTQLSQQGYNTPKYKPYQDLGHPLFLEAKKLILHSLGQDEPENKQNEFEAEEEIQKETRTDTLSKSPQDKMSMISGTSVFSRNRKNTKRFNQELQRTRQLISSVKQGQGYFYLLQKEEETKKLELQEKQRLQDKKCKTEPQPPRDSSTESSEEEGDMSKSVDRSRLFLTEVTEEQKKEKVIGRPFTPIHNSLFSTQVFDADPESLFRQLCALHWLLESLTLEPFSAMRPMTACWNVRDPGGCKISLKRINRAKDVEVKWEQFIMPGKPKKQSHRLLRNNFLRPRKASFLSISRFSTLSSTQSPTMGSVSSLHPSLDGTLAGANEYSDVPRESGEDVESTANSSFITHGKLSKEEEEPLSDYMQSLLQMIAESVIKDLDEEESQKKYKLIRDPSVALVKDSPFREEQEDSTVTTQRPKSTPATSLSSTSLFIKKKSNVFSEMRDMFFEVADEADMSLHDKVEAIERRRQEFSAQKFRSLDTVSHFHQDLVKMRQKYHHVKEERDCTDTQTWFGVLLSRIPPAMRKKLKIKNILTKLEKLEVKQIIRIRSHVFLKVLGGLRSWELCSPDLSVAIEFVREHLVQMPLEDYTTWLQERLDTSPQSRIQSAPLIR